MSKKRSSNSFITSRRSSTMPNVSAKPRSHFTAKQVKIAIILLVAFCIGYIALFVAVDTNRANELSRATKAAQEKERQFTEAMDEISTRKKELAVKERELASKERTLDNRQAALEKAETELMNDRLALADERDEFYAKYERVLELTSELSSLIDPAKDPNALIIEEIIEE